MKILLIFSYLIMVIQAISDEEQWQEFKTEYNKDYKSILKDTSRFQNFQKNLRKIEEHNEKYYKGEVSYKLGITKFADLTEKEFKKRLNSLRDSTDDEVLAFFPSSVSGEVPDEIDWREKGAVTSVKDQGDCISSSAFAAVASLESHNFLIKGKLVTLSEQYLIDCNTLNYGCSGGRVINSYLFIRDAGIVTEESYPYKAKDGTCTANGTLLRDIGFAAVQEGEGEFKNAVGLIGPIVASIDVSDMALYAGGVYYNPNCRNSTTNHQILVAGYGSTSDGTNYWLIKNSWGTKWGENGYLKVIRNKNNHCGITNSPIYPIILSYDVNHDEL